MYDATNLPVVMYILGLGKVISVSEKTFRQFTSEISPCYENNMKISTAFMQLSGSDAHNVDSVDWGRGERVGVNGRDSYSFTQGPRSQGGWEDYSPPNNFMKHTKKKCLTTRHLKGIKSI